MNQTDKYSRRSGMMAIIMVLMIGGVLGTGSYGQSDSTLRVNVGESITLTVDSVAKLAIAEPTTADVVPLSDKEISVIGKKVGVTTLTIVRTEKATQIYRVEVGNDVAVAAIRKAVGSPNITIRQVGDTVILDGYVNDELEAQRAGQIAAAIKGLQGGNLQVVNLIEVRKPRQARVRTRVAEVNSDAVKNVGFRWFGPAGEVHYALDYTGGGSVIHGLVQPLANGGNATDPTTLDIGADVLLQLLIAKNYAKLLSEPTLTTLSGKEASFLVGQEVPITQQLPNSFTVEFKEVGVRMKIKPTVDSQNQINTIIHAEVSQIIGAGVNGIPIIGTKQADTALQVKDAQTIVIGGLIENNVEKDFLRKVPWLGEIPVLGALFRDKQFQQGQREVLFFMTPEIVKDVEGETAGASKTPAMKDWMKNASTKVLENPKKGEDWGVHEPGSMGLSSVESHSSKASAPATAAPAKSEGVAPEATTNFTPARPSGQ